MGEFVVMGEKWQNNIMNEGVKKLMRILGNVNEENQQLVKISVGTSSDNGEDKTMTELVSEVGSKYNVGSFGINGLYPFDLELTTTIPDTEIDRPTVIKEIGIWFGDNVLFARAVNETGKSLPESQAVVIKYSLNIPL